MHNLAMIDLLIFQQLILYLYQTFSINKVISYI